MGSCSNHPSFALRAFTLAAAWALLVLSAETVQAGQAKVDLCHLDEDGLYHLVSVAEPAVPAHIGHGDSLPGDIVPGSGGRYSFAGDCTFIPGCPCVVDLPSGWQAVAGMSSIFLEECPDGSFVESSSGRTFDEDGTTLSYAAIGQCDAPTLFSCSAGENTREISEAQYEACLATQEVP